MQGVTCLGDTHKHTRLASRSLRTGLMGYWDSHSFNVLQYFPMTHYHTNLYIYSMCTRTHTDCTMCSLFFQVCAECTENFCIGCFARFHQKGALKLHRMITIQVSMVPCASSLSPLCVFVTLSVSLFHRYFQ